MKNVFDRTEEVFIGTISTYFETTFLKLPKTKLMRLGVANRIVVVESNLKSKCDRRFRSDSDIKLILFNLNSIYFDLKIDIKKEKFD